MGYDFAPVETILRQRLDDAHDTAIADALGVDRGNLPRWRRNGLTLSRAEKCAVTLGKMTYDLWPQILDDAVASVEKVCARDGCSGRFFLHLGTGGQGRKFCTHRCAQRAWRGRNTASLSAKRTAVRRSNPVEAEKNRERRRAYYRENAEYEKARQRRYYHASKAA